jgi:endonuclease/exonuclease/phosphatase (EEP) superfamily protein YafD
VERGVAGFLRRRHRLAGGAVAFVLVASAAATALLPAAENYLDAAGPRYGGRAAPSADPDPGSLTVASYNVRFALHPEEAAEVLAEHPELRQADIVALQEMNAHGAAKIAAALGLHWVYYPAARHPSAGGDFGNAVLSRFPIAADHKVLLPGRSLPRGMARTATAADVVSPLGLLRVYSVHAETPVGLLPAARAAQVQAVCADASGFDGPIIVAGDFNARDLPGSVLPGCGFAWATRGSAPTVGPFAWDHVFARGLPPASLSGVAVEGLKASNHAAVWARWVDRMPRS